MVTKLHDKVLTKIIYDCYHRNIYVHNTNVQPLSHFKTTTNLLYSFHCAKLYDSFIRKYPDYKSKKLLVTLKSPEDKKLISRAN